MEISFKNKKYFTVNGIKTKKVKNFVEIFTFRMLFLIETDYAFP